MPNEFLVKVSAIKISSGDVAGASLCAPFFEAAPALFDGVLPLVLPQGLLQNFAFVRGVFSENSLSFSCVSVEVFPVLQDEVPTTL